jgi:hypothetical protein
MADHIKIGDRVRCGVYVMGEWKPMHIGIVTRDHGDGTYDVDRMSPHGGRPWVEREQWVRPEPAGVPGTLPDECGTCRKAIPEGCRTEFQGNEDCALTYGVKEDGKC